MFSYNLHAGFINSVLGFWAGEGEGLMKLTSVVRVSSPPPVPPPPYMIRISLNLTPT